MLKFSIMHDQRGHGKIQHSKSEFYQKQKYNVDSDVIHAPDYTVPVEHSSGEEHTSTEIQCR